MLADTTDAGPSQHVEPVRRMPAHVQPSRVAGVHQTATLQVLIQEPGFSAVAATLATALKPLAYVDSNRVATQKTANDMHVILGAAGIEWTSAGPTGSGALSCCRSTACFSTRRTSTTITTSTTTSSSSRPNTSQQSDEWPFDFCPSPPPPSHHQQRRQQRRRRVPESVPSSGPCHTSWRCCSRHTVAPVNGRISISSCSCRWQ
jgi:hypothetical protein